MKKKKQHFHINGYVNKSRDEEIEFYGKIEQEQPIG